MRADTDLWIPICMEKQISPGWNGLEDEWFQSNYLLARLKPGVSIQQTDANVNLLFRQWLHQLAGPQPTKKDLQDIEHARINITSAATGLSRIRFQLSKSLQILMAVVGLVLLIACANIANLLLARASARHREIAVRQALGAARLRLVRQLITESLLLAGFGGILGVALAWGLLHLLVMMSAGSQTMPMNVMPDGTVLAFTLGVTLLTAMLFGTLPALHSTRLHLETSLNERGATYGMRRGLLAKALVVSQVALSLVLLVGAGLFVHSLVNLLGVNTGFDEQNVLLFHIDESAAGYKEDGRLTRLFQRIERRVTEQPSIKAASFSFFTFNQGAATAPVFVPGQIEQSHEVWQNTVGPDYFKTMGIPLVLGRYFSLLDTDTSPKVAVINQTMARVLFPKESPIGHRFSVGRPDASKEIEVVGVVKDAKYGSLAEPPRLAVYYPYTQHPQYLGDFEVRYSGDPRAVISEVRRMIGEVDRNLPVSGITTLARQVNDSAMHDELLAQLSTFFALLALFLSCIGIYGLMAYAVAGRTNEIGIRMALGARRSDILWSVLRESLLLVVVGVTIGLPVVIGATTLVRSLLFEVVPTDPIILTLATALMFVVATLAGYIPARRAAKVDPMVALRYE